MKMILVLKSILFSFFLSLFLKFLTRESVLVLVISDIHFVLIHNTEICERYLFWYLIFLFLIAYTQFGNESGTYFHIHFSPVA